MSIELYINIISIIICICPIYIRYCSCQELLKKIEAMAESKKCSAAQLSLAWRGARLLFKDRFEALLQGH